MDEKKTELAYRLYDEKKHTVSEICQMLAISKPTLYAYLGRRQKSPLVVLFEMMDNSRLLCQEHFG